MGLIDCMRCYHIYLITDDVTRQYYGRENLIFSLFFEYERKANTNRELLLKQIQYITNVIPVDVLEQFIQTRLFRKKGYKVNTRDFVITISTPTSQAYLQIFESSLILYSKGTLEAETIFFEVIRKFDPSFLAMEFDIKKVGWLSPIKNQDRKYV